MAEAWVGYAPADHNPLLRPGSATARGRIGSGAVLGLGAPVSGASSLPKPNQLQQLPV